MAPNTQNSMNKGSLGTLKIEWITHDSSFERGCRCRFPSELSCTDKLSSMRATIITLYCTQLLPITRYNLELNYTNSFYFIPRTLFNLWIQFWFAAAAWYTTHFRSQNSAPFPHSILYKFGYDRSLKNSDNFWWDFRNSIVGAAAAAAAAAE